MQDRPVSSGRAWDGPQDVLRRGVDKNERMLEIGASFNPVFAKRDGWPVKILDNENRDGGIAKGDGRWRLQRAAAINRGGARPRAEGAGHASHGHREVAQTGRASVYQALGGAAGT
jgi:hypothetical protein